jgi:hypothetical protein
MPQVNKQIWDVERDNNGKPVIVNGDTVPVLVKEEIIEVPDPVPTELDLLKQEVADLKEQLNS